MGAAPAAFEAGHAVTQAVNQPSAVARTLQKAGLSEVTMRLYPEARHEILNELNRDEVIADLLAWTQSVIAGDKIPAATTL